MARKEIKLTNLTGLTWIHPEPLSYCSLVKVLFFIAQQYSYHHVARISGTQFVGMGRDLLNFPLVKEMYELASSILGYNLLSLCLDGPKNTLDQTLFCQPAILVTSLASLEKLKALSPEAVENCVGTAGFSVGELAALVFSKAITFENGMRTSLCHAYNLKTLSKPFFCLAVKLVKIRAEAMQLASEVTPSGMMTVFYGPDSNLKKACEQARLHCRSLGIEHIDCAVANYLYPDCKVIAGNLEALEYVSKHAGDFKLKRLKRLPVSGAFHTKLMEPATAVLRKALKTIPISQPIIPVHSNVDGKRYKNADHIKKFLPRQVTSPVYWEQTMHILYERSKNQGFPKTYECGPGRSLRAILAKVNAKAAQHCTNIDV